MSESVILITVIASALLAPDNDQKAENNNQF